MKTIRILVVDDNATNRKLTASLLQFEGYEVLHAENADQAREVIKMNAPALILMDIQMPGMDGLTFTRHLKADQATSHIPIIAMTSFAMKGDDEKARAAGCDAYITKPIDTRKLPSQVAEFLARKQPSE
jgi:CheY-like chemotaxis protein